MATFSFFGACAPATEARRAATVTSSAKPWTTYRRRVIDRLSCWSFISGSWLAHRPHVGGHRLPGRFLDHRRKVVDDPRQHAAALVGGGGPGPPDAAALRDL